VTQGRQKRHGFPVAMRNFGHEPRTSRCPSRERCHVGLGPGLIDEDQALSFDPALILCPLGPPSRELMEPQVVFPFIARGIFLGIFFL
jgi:hypothetical protein